MLRFQRFLPPERRGPKPLIWPVTQARSQTKNKVTHSATVSCLDDQAQIRREGTTVASSRSFLVGIRRRQVVAQFAWALKVLSLVVGSIRVLDFFSKSTRFVHGVRNAHKVTPCDTVERVAGGADFAVYLEASSNAGMGSYAMLDAGIRKADWPVRNPVGMIGRNERHDGEIPPRPRETYDTDV